MSSITKLKPQPFVDYELNTDRSLSDQLQYSYNDFKPTEDSRQANLDHSEIQIPESSENQ